MATAEEKKANIKEQVYRDERPAEHFDRYHERARNKKPNIVYEVVRAATSLLGWIVYRVMSISPENVPDGPVILAPNHFSNLDHFFAGMAVRRHVRFMAKSQLFAPPMDWVYSNGGVFPVRRGARDEEVFITAKKILADGGCVLMYCEGGRSRTGGIGDEAKPGIGRLALETGVPIVPIAIHGSSEVRHWKRFVLPKVTVQYGDSIRWREKLDSTREDQQQLADTVLDRIRGLYSGLEGQSRRQVARAVRAAKRDRSNV
ncbi:MAG: lysophospholipid acyltransferase family protein [Solirubrobacterales bacterium]|nr:lysophospholipid acyltransferase family protein [Solirubrobacterales bacterium]